MGGEFDNNTFKTFASNNGLQFRFSCPHTSQQNGKAERMIRRLNEIMLSLLTHASLPSTFGVEALHTAVYLHNILPTKLLRYHTPTTALYLRHPTYDHLRVFGCACYPNSSTTRPHKLAPRSSLCVFLRYPVNYRGYRCLDLSTGKVILSCHVTFDESHFPYSSRKDSSSHDYSFLDSAPSPIIFDNHIPPPSTPSPPSPPPTPPPSPNPSPPPTPPSPHPSPPSTPLTPNPSPTPSPPPPSPPPPPTHPMITRARAGITKPWVPLNLLTPPTRPFLPYPNPTLLPLPIQIGMRP